MYARQSLGQEAGMRTGTFGEEGRVHVAHKNIIIIIYIVLTDRRRRRGGEARQHERVWFTHAFGCSRRMCTSGSGQMIKV